MSDPEDDFMCDDEEYDLVKCFSLNLSSSFRATIYVEFRHQTWHSNTLYLLYNLKFSHPVLQLPSSSWSSSVPWIIRIELRDQCLFFFFFLMLWGVVQSTSLSKSLRSVILLVRIPWVFVQNYDNWIKTLLLINGLPCTQWPSRFITIRKKNPLDWEEKVTTLYWHLVRLRQHFSKVTETINKVTTIRSVLFWKIHQIV